MLLDISTLPRFTFAASQRCTREGEYSFTGSSAATLTFTNVTPSFKRSKDRRIYHVKNRGLAMLTLASNSGSFFNGAVVTTMALQPGEAALLVATGAYLEVIATTSTFDEYKLITSAQLLALNATPISTIAAKGAGVAVIPTRWAVYKPAGTAYAGIAADEDLVLKYTNAAGEECSARIEATGFLDQATAQMRCAGMPAASFAPVANAAVVLHMLTGEIITGDSDLHLRVWYDVMPTVYTT